MINFIPSSFSSFNSNRLMDTSSMPDPIEEAFQSNPTNLYHFLTDLQRRDDLDAIRLLKPKYDKASSAQKEVIDKWYENLDPHQKDAYENGFHDKHMERDFEDVSASAEDVDPLESRESLEVMELARILSQLEKTCRGKFGARNSDDVQRRIPGLSQMADQFAAEIFDEVLGRIPALSQGADRSELLQRLIATIVPMAQDTWLDSVDAILALLPALQPKHHVDGLTALIKVVNDYPKVIKLEKEKAPHDKAWEVLEKMKTQILNLKPEPVDVWRALSRTWGETAEWWTRSSKHLPSFQQAWNEISQTLDAHRKSETEITTSRIAALSLNRSLDLRQSVPGNPKPAIPHA
jgi:hypothetical protein